MNVNFKNTKNQQTFKIFFVEKNKKNLNNLLFSSDTKINKYILERISKRNFNGNFSEICYFEAAYGNNNINLIIIMSFWL